VTSDAVATPKLSDICWSVLAIVLAMLVSAVATRTRSSTAVRGGERTHARTFGS
jgi:hypothetical protein